MIKKLFRYLFLILIMFVLVKCAMVFLHNDGLILLYLIIFCVFDYLNNRTKHINVVCPTTPHYYSVGTVNNSDPYKKSLELIDKMTVDVEKLIKINKSMQKSNQRMIDIAQEVIAKLDNFEKKNDTYSVYKDRNNTYHASNGFISLDNNVILNNLNGRQATVVMNLLDENKKLKFKEKDSE